MSFFSFAQGVSPFSITEEGIDPLNFVRTWEVQVPVRDPGVLMGMGVRSVRESTLYFDGLGRPGQTVQRQGSLSTAGGKATDLVSPVVYDGMGREAVRWLAYAATTSDGRYKEGALAAQQAFYLSGASPVTGQGESHFYSQTLWEPSLLGRVSVTFEPGSSWVGSGKGVTFSYRVNSGLDEVHRWTVSDVEGGLGLYRSEGVYPAGSLEVKVTTAEDSKRTVEYTDRHGRVLLRKVQAAEQPGAGHEGWLSTYYIYDDLEHLRAVLQPQAVEVMREAGSWTLDATTLDELCFRYAYDSKGQMTIKKVPGAAPVYMVYDARGRLVMTQDAGLRKPGHERWLVTRYDGLNRVLETGLWTSAEGLSHHTALASASDHYPDVASSGWELLTMSHYDDYQNLPAGLSPGLVPGYEESLNVADPDFAEPIRASTSTKGLVTWTITKVLGEDKYLASRNIYDDKGRVIQTQSSNYTSGTDVLTTRYDFAGKVLGSHLAHQKAGPAPATFELSTRNSYDDLGRIAAIEKNAGHTGWTKVSSLEYAAIGELKRKKLAPDYSSATGTPGLETLDYDYNIRGWLLGTNRSYLQSTGSPGYTSRFFGFELSYDKPASFEGSTLSTPQLNGNISLTRWKSSGDQVRRSYGFFYDAANRFARADFTQNTDPQRDGPYTTTTANFSVHGSGAATSAVGYDANGNILSMVQHGIRGTTPDAVIDDLHYRYNTHTNKLAQVTDDSNEGSSQSPLGDFSYDPARKTSVDYGYDSSGNLITDLNKGITGATGLGLARGGAISYNHLNLPELIDVAGRGSVRYVYDALGTKLSKTVHESGHPDKTTLYIQGMVYQDDQLEWLPHEEGRIRPMRDSMSQVSGYAYDYFLKDHLGNVRMVLTTEERRDAYPAASLEEATLATEKRYYQIADDSRVHKAQVPGYPKDDYTTPNDYVERLGGERKPLGTSIVLRVMAGDQISIRASSWYRQTAGAPGALTSPLEAIAASLLQGITGMSGSKALLATPGQQQTLLSSVAAFLKQQQDPASSIPSKPKSYLNYLMLDEQLHPVITQDGRNSGSQQVGAPDELTIHQITERAITKNGYVYIYLSNESTSTDVFFDNLQVTHTRGPLVEETHYYPFGLTMHGISSKAAGGTENRKKYNEIEFNEDLDLDTYDAFFRTLDPQLGRWWQIDPKPNYTYSSYSAMGNNPILLNDPLGDTIVPLHAPNGAHGTGHMAILIQNKDGKYALWSKNGTNESSGMSGPNDKGDDKGTLLYNSPSDFLKSDKNLIINQETGEREYSEGVQIPTTEKQDRGAEKGAKKELAKPYRLLGSNCATTVQCALAGAGQKDGSPSMLSKIFTGPILSLSIVNEKIPNLVYDRMKKQNLQGTTVYPEKPLYIPTSQDYQQVININLLR